MAKRPYPQRRSPLSDELGRLVRGITPDDGGALSNISAKEAARLRAASPSDARFIRPYLTSRALVHGFHRWCLRLRTPGNYYYDWKSSEISHRVARVSKIRPANHPLPPWALFEEGVFPSRIFVVPRRIPRALEVVPALMFDQGEVAGDQVWLITDNHLLTAGVVSSRLYRVWLAEISKSSGPDVGVGASSAHNTFPLPKLTEGQRERIEEAAERMLLARSYAMDSDFDELYSRSRMPKPLRDAHDDIDAVLAEVFGVDVEAGDARLRKVLRDTHRKLSDQQGGRAA